MLAFGKQTFPATRARRWQGSFPHALVQEFYPASSTPLTTGCKQLSPRLSKVVRLGYLLFIAIILLARAGGGCLCFPSPDTSDVGLAAEYLRDGDLERAELEVERTLRSNPGCGEAYNLLGQVRIQQGRLWEAEAFFLRATELAPQLADAYENLTLLELLRHKNREAQSVAEKLLQLDPRSYNGHLVSGIVDYDAGRYRVSLEHLEPLTGGESEPDPVALAISIEDCRHLRRLDDAKRFKAKLAGVTVSARDALLAAQLLQSEELQPYVIQWLQQPRTQQGETIQASYELGNVYFRMKRFELAEKHYLNALSKKPSDPNVLLRLCAVRESMGDSKSALSYLSQAKQAPKNNFPALMHYSLACLKRRMFIDAQRGLVRALEMQPGDVFAQYLLGIAAFNLGDFGMAERQFRAVLAKVPTHLEARVSLGVVFLTTSRRNEAEAQFRQALKMDNSSASAHYYLAQIYRRKGESAEATKELEKAIRLEPGDARPYVDLATLEIAEGQLAAASENLRTALCLDKQSAKAHYQRGVLMRKQGKLNEAEQEFQLAQKLRGQEEKVVILLTSKDSQEYGEFLPLSQ